MDQRRHSTAAGGSLGGPGMMLLSAAIFGYFGFGMSWTHYSIFNGSFVLFFALLDYTLKGSAIAFLAAGLLTFVKPLPGNLLYGLAGVIGAALLLVVAAMDFMDKQHTAISPLLLLIFVAWNGFSSFAGLREAMGVMRARSAARGDQTFGPE